MCIIAFHRRVKQRTSSGNWIVFAEIFDNGNNRHEFIGSVCSIFYCKRHSTAYQVDSIIKTFNSQLFLAFKMIINAALIKPCHAHYVRHRGTKISLAVEQLGCLLDYLFACSIALSHSKSPFQTDWSESRLAPGWDRVNRM